MKMLRATEGNKAEENGRPLKGKKKESRVAGDVDDWIQGALLHLLCFLRMERACRAFSCLLDTWQKQKRTNEATAASANGLLYRR